MRLARSNSAEAPGGSPSCRIRQSLLATADLGLGEIEQAGAAFESAFALGCQMADPCWEGLAARGIGLVHRANGRIDEAIAWLDDARTRCIRIPDAYLWVHAWCLDALCAVADRSQAPVGRSESGERPRAGGARERA